MGAMGNGSDDAAFAAEDFSALTELVLTAWASAVARDWSVPAGTLEWSCFDTADHTIDCVFSYALFFASGAQHAYPPFGELHALPGATPADLVEGLRAVTSMLHAVIVAAPANTRSIMFSRRGLLGGPNDFAARGAHEMIVHAHDVCTGLGVALEPPRDICRRLRDHTRDWPIGPEIEPTEDPWSDLLERSGRARLS